MVTEEQLREAVALVDRIRRSPAVLRLCMLTSRLKDDRDIDSESIHFSADYANSDNTIGFFIRFQYDMDKTNSYNTDEFMEYVTIPVTEVVTAMNEEE